MNVLVMVFFLSSNLYKGMDRINLEVYDQVSSLDLREIELFDDDDFLAKFY